MRKFTKPLAALLACCLAAQPACAVVRGVQIKPVTVSPSGAAAGAVAGHSLSLPTLSLPSLTFGSPAHPTVTHPSALPSQPSAAVSAISGTKAETLSLPAPTIPYAPAGEVRASQKGIFQKKLQTLEQRFHAKEGEKKGAESFAHLFEASLQKWEGGKLGSADAVSAAGELLADEIPRFTPRQMDRVRNASKAIETAVTRAMTGLLPQAGLKAVSRGSSARLTQAHLNADHDIMVKMPADWSLAELDEFMRAHVSDIKAQLEETLRRETASLFPGKLLQVAIGSYVQLSDPVTRRPDAGVYMLPVKIMGAKKELLLDVDITFTSQEKYANDYPGYFAHQIEQVARMGGDVAVDNVLTSIRLAKRLFEDVVGAYKVWRGGPSGVGVEQMIMQSGKVEDADKGRTVIEAGDFDKFMDRIYDISFNQEGGYRGAKQARRRWEVYNPFREPANFLNLISEKAWRRLAAAARNYRLARASGRPVSFAELGFRSGTSLPGGEKTAARESEENVPGRRTINLLERFTTDGPQPTERGDAFLYAQGARALPAGLESSWAGRRTSASPADSRNTVERTLLKRTGGDAFILVPTMRRDGSPGYRPVKVPLGMIEGVVTNTLVEAELSESRIVSVTPIGSYAMDMMIGRAVKRGGQWTLESLFSDESGPRALYSRLPLTETEGLIEGGIVQAFIQPKPGGFAAEALMHLGLEITPAIAAREIALRHGARGYFDEAVIRQAEAAGENKAVPEQFKDMTELPFVTIDPIGAGDLDDAYYVEKHADGSYTWYLATADVAQYVPPGSAAFRTAARIGNTFYSIDKDGVPEYPMNHPVVSKFAASLLAGKDSPAMITRMRFGPSGEFIAEGSDIYLGKVRVQGRYTYEQVVALWQGKKDHGVTHTEQIALARELARTLDTSDSERGKLPLRFQQVAHKKDAAGAWGSEFVKEDPLLSESHKLIEELKVYGNRSIAQLLERITAEFGVPHISRVHPEQEESVNLRLRKEINKLGLQWGKGETLWDFLKELQTREDLSPEGREAAQILALMTRRTAQYATTDAEGHEGLALKAGQYDHPSTPIRRFADMYNRTILEAYLEGGDPQAVYRTVLADLKNLGFHDLDDYMTHLNGRESASKLMDREVDEFMSIYELSKPERQGRKFRAYVKVARDGRNPLAVLQFSDLPISITLRGEAVGNLKLLDQVEVTVQGADPARLKVDADVRKVGKIQAVRR